jgi:hypothetical protein
MNIGEIRNIEEELSNLQHEISKGFHKIDISEISRMRKLEKRANDLYSKIKNKDIDVELKKEVYKLRFLNILGAVKKFDVVTNYFNENLDPFGHSKSDGEIRYYFALHDDPIRYNGYSVTVCENPPFHEQIWHWHPGSEENTITLAPKIAKSVSNEYHADQLQRINIEPNIFHTLKNPYRNVSPDFTVKGTKLRTISRKRTNPNEIIDGNKCKMEDGIKIFSPQREEDSKIVYYKFEYPIESKKIEVRIAVIEPLSNYTIEKDEFNVIHPFPWCYSIKDTRYNNKRIYGIAICNKDKKPFYGGDLIISRNKEVKITNLSKYKIQILEVDKIE